MQRHSLSRCNLLNDATRRQKKKKKKRLQNGVACHSWVHFADNVSAVDPKINMELESSAHWGNRQWRQQLAAFNMRIVPAARQRLSNCLAGWLAGYLANCLAGYLANSRASVIAECRIASQCWLANTTYTSTDSSTFWHTHLWRLSPSACIAPPRTAPPPGR